MAFLSAKRIRQARDFPITCKIELEPEQSSYGPGDVIEGVLIVSHTKERMNLRGIRVALQGSSLARFREAEQIHHKTEIFLDEGVYVLGGDKSIRAKTNLPSGTSSFPFQIHIPKSFKLPSSFKSPIGLIIYQVLGLLDVELQMLKKAEKTIHFIGCTRIKGNEVGIEVEKTLSRATRESDVDNSCKYTFKTSTSGFVLGRDAICFEMTVYKAGQSVKDGIVSLVQKVTYYGGTVSRAWKDTYTVIGQVINKNWNEGDENDVEWRGVLEIGKDLIPSFTGGGVIEFRYLLRVSLETSDGLFLKSEHPIKIGTSKLNGIVNQAEVVATEGQLNHLKISDSPGPSLDAISCSKPNSTPSLPSYSTLSLRTDSFETLPPEYEDVAEELNDNHSTSDIMS